MTCARALLVLGLAQAGCAATTGQEWLNAPVEPQTTLLPPSVETTEATPEAPQRLNHTVTLGESYAAYPAHAASAPGAPAVQVNVPVVINNYAGYGPAYGYIPYGSGSYGARGIVGAPIRASSGASQKVGADFPAVPDYGPRAMK
jgi:hypothetical protein